MSRDGKMGETLEKSEIQNFARILHEARKNGAPIPQISKEVSGFARPHAYSIQEAQFQLRLEDGERQVGWKMGLTSEAKRQQMNLDAPLYGFLMDSMEVSKVFSLDGSIHPKIEPEIAFKIKKDLKLPVTRDEVLNAVQAVAPALEILDSRYEQFKYFSMEDVISDNSSSSHFILGPWREDFSALDLADLNVEMTAGEEVTRGNTKDVSGDPVISVVQLVELLAERGEILKAGSVVLTGAITAAVALKPKMQIILKIDQLEPVTVGVE